VVTLGFVIVIAGFVLLAVPPISHEVQTMVTNYPRYKAEIASGRGWLGNIATKLHLTSYLKNTSHLKLPASGVLGAGKVVLSLGVATVSVVALTIYFLIALPGVRKLWLALIPRSRRDRVGLLTDEVFDRVGGFMLGNLLTSLVSGVLTYVWLLAFGVPYAVLLALFVALFDLIPMVGSTIAGIVVALVALTKGLGIGIATAVFYVVYRFLEDYLVNPRVMKHTVKVTPGLTIVATLIGGTLLGLVGALVAIPVAATIHLLLEEVAFPSQNKR
jgi:predicted PurR-regulated permease PerM